MNLEVRSNELEIMDDFEIKGQAIDQTLRELDIINQTLGGNHISLNCFKKLLKSERIKTVADLGCGSGDVIKRMAKISGTSVQYIGYDANAYIVEYATKHTAMFPNISYRAENIFDDAFRKQSFDVIHCCLFLHHFTQEQLVSLFRSFQKQARIAIIVNDLHRHWLAYRLIGIITRFFSKSYLVRNDASLSVARGFKRSELKEILHKSGITQYSLSWRWAFRWELVIKT